MVSLQFAHLYTMCSRAGKHGTVARVWAGSNGDRFLAPVGYPSGLPKTAVRTNRVI